MLVEWDTNKNLVASFMEPLKGSELERESLNADARIKLIKRG